MKNSIVIAATAGLFASVAHAQSSVTLYGIIDEGLSYSTNSGGHSLWTLNSGVLQGSRFGLRTSEDLGGGVKAIATLENGFDASNGRLGQGGLMFGRQAYVGLSSGQAGTATFGRQYDSVVDYVGQLGAADQWGGYIAAHPGDLDNFNNAYRSNNTIKYRSPTYSGVSFGGTYSLGGIAGNVTANQIWSVGVGYSGGPLTAGVGYLNARTPYSSGGLFNNSGTVASQTTAVASTVYSGYSTASTYQVIAAAVAYTMGAATLGATYSNIKFMDLASNGASVYARGASASFNNGELNFKYQLTPALLLGAAFDYTDRNAVTLASGQDSGGAKYYQGAVGVDYFLSKRTDLYFIGVYQKASGTDSRNGAAVANITNFTASSSDRQTVLRLGMRHKF